MTTVVLVLTENSVASNVNVHLVSLENDANTVSLLLPLFTHFSYEVFDKIEIEF